MDQDNGGTLAIVPLTGGSAHIVTAALTAGIHHLLARYLPAGLFVPGDSAPATVTVTAPAAADAATYQQNVGHDGNAAGSTITKSLHQAWQSSAPANTTFLYPVVGGGRVFGVTEDPNHAVSAFDLATGAALWGLRRRGCQRCHGPSRATDSTCSPSPMRGLSPPTTGRPGPSHGLCR